MQDLEMIQYQLEDEMRTTGTQKFINNQRNSVDVDAGSNTGAGMMLINGYASKFADILKEEGERKLRGAPGIHARVFPLLTDICTAKSNKVKWDVIAIASLTTYIDYAIGRKKHTKEFLARKIGAALEDEARFAYMNANYSTWMKFKVEEFRKTGRSYANQRSGIIFNGNRTKGGFEEWTKSDKLEVGFLILELMRSHFDLVEEHKRQVGNKTHTTFELSEDALAIIDEFNERVSVMCNDYRPCVVPPVEWTGFRRGGYLTIEMPFLKVPQYSDIESVDFTRHMRTVNAIQSTPWTIDTEMFDLLVSLYSSDTDLVSSKGKTILNTASEVTAPAREAILNDEALIGTDEHTAALRRYKAGVVNTIVTNNRRKSKRRTMHDALRIASNYKEYDKIYFPHQVDFRGRAYPIPTILHPQAADNVRALLKFAEKKKLDERGLYWLGIHVAGLWGYDKVSLDERYQCVLDKMDEVKQVAQKPIDCKEIWLDADKPFQFIQGCREFFNAYTAMKNGEDFYSDVPVQVDGKCNGLQHYTLMSRDETVAPYVGLVPLEKPEDIYTKVADGTIELLKKVKEPVRSKMKDDKAYEKAREEYELAQAWLEYGVPRSLAKRPTMTCVYGSDTYGYAEQLKDELESLNEEYRPQGNLFKLCNYLAKFITKALSNEISGAIDAMDFLKTITREYTKYYNGKASSPGLMFHTPTGLMIVQNYSKSEYKETQVRLGNKRAKIKVKSYINGMNPTQMANGICPNFVHSIDASHMMLTIEKCLDNGFTNFSMIHDSYGVHASDIDELVNLIKESAIEMYSEDLLQNFRDEIASKLPPKIADKLPNPPAKGDLDINLLRDADFFFS